MTQLDEDLTRLVLEDPLPVGTADTAGLIRLGSRMRRRRQLAITAGAGLAAAAVIAPFMLLGGNDDTVGLSPATSPSVTGKAVAATPGTCGIAACMPNRGNYGSLERGELIGAQLEMGTFDGATEVLYAFRDKGHDTSTGEPKDSVDVIASGIVVDGQLRRTVWAFQPHEDPMVGPVGLYGGERTVSADGQAHFGVFGYVAGEHAEVTATIDGETRPVSGLSTDVLPGYTVFYDTAAWNESWDFRAAVTYGVPGGASCSLAECGTVG